MKKRYALFGMTVLLAASLAVPAFGGPSNPVSSTFASAKSTAKKALTKAKSAQKAAKAAQNTADDAVNDAAAAQTTANQARTAATGAQTTADNAATAAAAAQTSADNAATAAAAAQTTADSKYGDMSVVFGDVSPSDSTNKTAIAACTGDQEPTGGGHIMGGAGANDVTIVTSSQYFSGWIVNGSEIGAGTADNWTLQAMIDCIT